MDKSTLEACKAELEQQFSALQTQKDETLKKLYQIQGAHSLVCDFLGELNKKEAQDAPNGRSTKKPAK